MEIDFTPFFKQYEEVTAMANGVFARVQKDYPQCVTCKPHCSDCCHALFDLSLIEALYINHRFNEKFSGEEKERLIEKANKADRTTYKIKKKANKDLEAGQPTDTILTAIAEERVRCPLLNEEDECDLYEFRPVTCRLYGIPTSIGNKAYTCGISGFSEGEKYPTVKLEIIQNKLYEISAELVNAIQSKYVKMADMLVPLSMALLTDYNEKYLGINQDEKSKKSSGGSDE